MTILQKCATVSVLVASVLVSVRILDEYATRALIAYRLAEAERRAEAARRADRRARG